MVIYVSGSLPKRSDKPGAFSWTASELAALQQRLRPLRPTLLNPSSRMDDLGDAEAAFGRDVLQVRLSDAVVVDARAKRGIGVGAEMLFAKTLRIPLVSLCAPNSHYRRTDLTFLGQALDEWTHPFVFALSDFVASDVDEAADWLLGHLHKPHAHIKGPEVIDDAIAHYTRSQLAQDDEMRSFLGTRGGLTAQGIKGQGRQAA